MLLKTYYAKLGLIKGLGVGVNIPNSPERSVISSPLASHASPRKKEAYSVANRVLQDEHSLGSRTVKSDLTTTLVNIELVLSLVD